MNEVKIPVKTGRRRKVDYQIIIDEKINNPHLTLREIALKLKVSIGIVQRSLKHGKLKGLI